MDNEYNKHKLNYQDRYLMKMFSSWKNDEEIQKIHDQHRIVMSFWYRISVVVVGLFSLCMILVALHYALDVNKHFSVNHLVFVFFNVVGLIWASSGFIMAGDREYLHNMTRKVQGKDCFLMQELVNTSPEAKKWRDDVLTTHRQLYNFDFKCMLFAIEQAEKQKEQDQYNLACKKLHGIQG